MTAAAPTPGPVTGPVTGRRGVAGRTDAPLTAVAHVLAGAAAVIGAAVVVGWLVDSELLLRVAPTLVPMAFNAGVCLLLLGASWFVPRGPALALDAVVVAVAVATLVEYLVPVDLHIDQLFVHDTLRPDYPGRMAGAAAVCLVLIGTGRIALLLGRLRFVQILAVTALAISALAVLGYAYGVQSLYRIAPMSTLALHAAVALHLLGLALMASVPGGLMPWVVRGSDAGGLLLRRLLPVALIGLPLIGYVRLRGQEAGWYDVSFGLAVHIVAGALLVAGVAWTAARALARVDRGRLSAIDDLRQLTAELEDRVEERVAQVEAHHARIAVLEDRERIAADLHDVVVQRLFAAGVQLQSVVGLPDREAMTARIDQAIDGIDAAIHDLRASILELKSVRGSSDLATEVTGIVDAAQVVLGFRPALVTRGRLDRAAVAGDDLLAVLREGLANVARHARAHTVAVTVCVDDSRVSLTIADDGIGIAPGTVDSGRRNMRTRAEAHGGHCVWSDAVPHGTVVEWTVPLTADPHEPVTVPPCPEVAVPR